MTHSTNGDSGQSNFSQNGGLTLVPMPGFEGLADSIKSIIESKPRSTKIDIATPIISSRPSGEPFVILQKDHIGGHDCMILTSGPGTREKLVDTMLVLGYLVGRKARRINLISGYLPLSRSDKDEGTTELALLPMIISWLVSASFGELRRIVSCNLHSPQSVMAGRPGFITEISMVRRVLKRALIDVRSLFPDKLVTLLLPDENAQKRFELEIARVKKETGVEFSIICAQKRHLGDKTKIVGLSGDVDHINGSIIISLDDEVSTLGTTVEAISFIREKYVFGEFLAVAVHGVLSGSATEILDDVNSPISKLYLTDTIPLHNRPRVARLIENKRIIVVSWENDLAEVIDHLHWDESIREIR
ncbi:MAG: hypothetical protein UT53_C0014G0009 [Candidatus Yanofskybacteria bacterium GW2011_GWD2_39_48]|uniref:ribose-phosphate diphosphokinase n=1 Tax=Candidatus Yanofskybacteria bacterium GW2011_GWD2_39_48 TaxID=1619031 RepID=A0A0G0PEE1_9BACT|nr:MAG: hypothetical protein UT53_C0014G0009 [Candidatus Yanofskybacteria bacterium GW2011_GWD2_39_48]